jgi:hypothetical protein
MRGASPRKGAKTTAAKQKDLAKLGTYLSGKGSGSADAAASRSAARTTKLKDAVNTSRGGGQRKAAPKKASPGINDRMVDVIDAGVRTVGAAGRAVGRAVTPSPKKMSPSERRKSFAGYNPKPSTPYTGTWNVSSRKKPGK